jgi:hypothetical protein
VSGIINIADIQQDLREWDRVLEPLNQRLVLEGDETARAEVRNARTASSTFMRTVNVGNVSSVQSVPPLTSVEDSGSATLTIAPHTVTAGDVTIAYGGATITGLSLSTRYYVYADDPDFVGGSVTYAASTDRTDVVTGLDRYYAGQILTPRPDFIGTVTAATSTNPPSLTVTGHSFTTGDTVTASGFAQVGWVGLNGNTYTLTVVDANTVTIDVDASGFSTWTAGGQLSYTSVGTTGDPGSGGATLP